MRFRDCTKNEQAWIVFGGVLVVLGLVLLMGGFSTWWTSAFAWMRQLSRLLIPLVLLAVGIYVVWASRKGKFAHVFNRQQVERGAPPVFERSKSDYRVAGVCGGIAQYFGIDSTIVRTIAVLLGFASPLLTFVTYLILSLLLRKST